MEGQRFTRRMSHNTLIKKAAMHTEIYGLYCPDSGALRYIGKANDSVKRLKSHVRDSQRRDTPVYRWFRKLSAEGKVPTIAVLETVTDGAWQPIERAQIILHRQAGARLLNVAEGGDEPFCSTEQRASNGRAIATAIHSHPKRKRVWALKRGMGQALKFLKEQGMFDKYNHIVAGLHLAAKKAPALFGEYAALQPIS